MMSNSEQVDIDDTYRTIDLNKNEKTLLEPAMYMLGHDVHDQRLIQNQQTQQLSIQLQLRSIQKFNGHGDPELWLKTILEKFDSLQLTLLERNELIPDILTGEALIWYAIQQDHMPTFITFVKNFLQHYGQQELKTESSTTFISSSIQLKQAKIIDYKETFMDCLRTQMLITTF